MGIWLFRRLRITTIIIDALQNSVLFCLFFKKKWLVTAWAFLGYRLVPGSKLAFRKPAAAEKNFPLF